MARLVAKWVWLLNITVRERDVVFVGGPQCGGGAAVDECAVADQGHGPVTGGGQLGAQGRAQGPA